MKRIDNEMIASLYSMLYIFKNTKLYLFIYRCIKLFLNVYYPIYCRLHKNNDYTKINEQNVIVSLTTFPDRINSVWIIIETLLRQTQRPRRIVLWLAESQFKSKEELPKRLLLQQKRGLEIRFCDDLRSHKKYYYAIKDNPDAIVITVDDDTFYPEDLIESLLKTHDQHPDLICCFLAHLMKVEGGRILPYESWESGADGYEEASHYLVPIGCEGVLYPPGCLNENLFDKEQITLLCPLADDLWLKAMAALNGVKAIKCRSTSITFANLIGTNKNSLCRVNVEQNMNDKQMNNILSQYPKLKELWK